MKPAGRSCAEDPVEQCSVWCHDLAPRAIPRDALRSPVIYVVALFGVTLTLLSVAGLAAPALILDRARVLRGRRDIRKAAILIRVVVGGIVMIAAFDTEYTMTLLIIGALVLFAGVALIFIDDARFAAIIEWAFGLPEAAIRCAFAAGCLFGAFLVYAVSA